MKHTIDHPILGKAITPPKNVPDQSWASVVGCIDYLVEGLYIDDFPFDYNKAAEQLRLARAYLTGANSDGLDEGLQQGIDATKSLELIVDTVEDQNGYLQNTYLEEAVIIDFLDHYFKAVMEQLQAVQAEVNTLRAYETEEQRAAAVTSFIDKYKDELTMDGGKPLPRDQEERSALIEAWKQQQTEDYQLAVVVAEAPERATEAIAEYKAQKEALLKAAAKALHEQEVQAREGKERETPEEYPIVQQGALTAEEASHFSYPELSYYGNMLSAEDYAIPLEALIEHARDTDQMQDLARVSYQKACEFLLNENFVEAITIVETFEGEGFINLLKILPNITEEQVKLLSKIAAGTSGPTVLLNIVEHSECNPDNSSPILTWQALERIADLDPDMRNNIDDLLGDEEITAECQRENIAFLLEALEQHDLPKRESYDGIDPYIMDGVVTHIANQEEQPTVSTLERIIAPAVWNRLPKGAVCHGIKVIIPACVRQLPSETVIRMLTDVVNDTEIRAAGKIVAVAVDAAIQNKDAALTKAILNNEALSSHIGNMELQGILVLAYRPENREEFLAAIDTPCVWRRPSVVICLFDVAMDREDTELFAIACNQRTPQNQVSRHLFDKLRQINYDNEEGYMLGLTATYRPLFGELLNEDEFVESLEPFEISGIAYQAAQQGDRDFIKKMSSVEKLRDQFNTGTWSHIIKLGLNHPDEELLEPVLRNPELQQRIKKNASASETIVKAALERKHTDVLAMFWDSDDINPLVLVYDHDAEVAEQDQLLATLLSNPAVLKKMTQREVNHVFDKALGCFNAPGNMAVLRAIAATPELQQRVSAEQWARAVGSIVTKTEDPAAGMVLLAEPAIIERIAAVQPEGDFFPSGIEQCFIYAATCGDQALMERLIATNAPISSNRWLRAFAQTLVKNNTEVSAWLEQREELQAAIADPNGCVYTSVFYVIVQSNNTEALHKALDNTALVEHLTPEQLVDLCKSENLDMQSVVLSNNTVYKRIQKLQPDQIQEVLGGWLGYDAVPFLQRVIQDNAMSESSRTYAWRQLFERDDIEDIGEAVKTLTEGYSNIENVPPIVFPQLTAHAARQQDTTLLEHVLQKIPIEPAALQPAMKAAAKANNIAAVRLLMEKGSEVMSEKAWFSALKLTRSPDIMIAILQNSAAFKLLPIEDIDFDYFINEKANEDVVRTIVEQSQGDERKIDWNRVLEGSSVSSARVIVETPNIVDQITEETWDRFVDRAGVHLIPVVANQPQVPDSAWNKRFLGLFTGYCLIESDVCLTECLAGQPNIVQKLTEDTCKSALAALKKRGEGRLASAQLSALLRSDTIIAKIPSDQWHALLGSDHTDEQIQDKNDILRAAVSVKNTRVITAALLAGADPSLLGEAAPKERDSCNIFKDTAAYITKRMKTDAPLLSQPDALEGAIQLQLMRAYKLDVDSLLKGLNVKTPEQLTDQGFAGRVKNERSDLNALCHGIRRVIEKQQAGEGASIIDAVTEALSSPYSVSTLIRNEGVYVG